MEQHEWTQYRAMVDAAYAAAEAGFQWGGARTALDDGYSRWMRAQTDEESALKVTEKMAYIPELALTNALYEKAEEAFAAGVTLERAIQAVRDGYSSAEFDKQYRDDE